MFFRKRRGVLSEHVNIVVMYSHGNYVITPVADWDSMGRVVTQTRSRAF